MYLWGPDVRDSCHRPHAFLKWSSGLNDGDGELFWSVLTEIWPSFDLVPHERFSRELQRFRSSAPGHKTDVKIYRGQNSPYELGLSWTLDKRVAVDFAQGHRGKIYEDPTICIFDAAADEIAFHTNARCEAEIVLFEIPSQPFVDFEIAVA